MWIRTSCMTAMLCFAALGCETGPKLPLEPPPSPDESPMQSEEPPEAVVSDCNQPIPENLQGQAAAEALMGKWKEKHPDVDWEADERRSRTFIPVGGQLPSAGHRKSERRASLSNVTEHDLLTWKRETERLVVAGSKVFHSADELGSTIAVSCDMCHPNAANTHPETYPKFQTQIGKVVLLRDMINWCLEQATRAPRMNADDPRMRAMEAYIISQRTGKTMEYGKH